MARASSTSKRQRLPKPPLYKAKPTVHASNEDVERAREVASRPVPASDTCTWYEGAVDYGERPYVCGATPVVADYFNGRRRISCLCAKHDRHAQRFITKVDDHRRVPRW